MAEVLLSPPIVETLMQPDLRPLHAALGRTARILDVLQLCEATAAAYGAGLWLATCFSPHPASYACGSQPVADKALRHVVADMHASLRASVRKDPRVPNGNVESLWRDQAARSVAEVPREYGQIELWAAGVLGGLLRVTRGYGERTEACDWEVVESIMCAASPHIVACLQRESDRITPDPITLQCTAAEMTARVEREIYTVGIHPAELALVVMELRMGPGREPGVLTDSELQAVGEALGSSLRQADSACRLASGRFCLLLPMTSQRNALIATDRVLSRLRAHPGLSPEVECNTGVSGWTFDGSSTPELFEQAGIALERAKRAGARGAFVFI